MDKWAWARIPDESIANGLLRGKGLKYMIHKPYGPSNANAPCMQLDRNSNRKKCNKKFLQPFRSTATINDKTGRIEYTRVKNEKDKPTVRMMVDGKWTNVPVGDEWVASCNPYLLPGIEYYCVLTTTSTLTLLLPLLALSTCLSTVIKQKTTPVLAFKA